MFSYEDRRRARMFESGWRNTIVKLPSKPPPYIPCPEEVQSQSLITDHPFFLFHSIFIDDYFKFVLPLIYASLTSSLVLT